jgi:hypothetical protein
MVRKQNQEHDELSGSDYIFSVDETEMWPFSARSARDSTRLALALNKIDKMQ